MNYALHAKVSAIGESHGEIRRKVATKLRQMADDLLEEKDDAAHISGGAHNDLTGRASFRIEPHDDADGCEPEPPKNEEEATA